MPAGMMHLDAICLVISIRFSHRKTLMAYNLKVDMTYNELRDIDTEFDESDDLSEFFVDSQINV
jgi:hypothetical protein